MTYAPPALPLAALSSRADERPIGDPDEDDDGDFDNDEDEDDDYDSEDDDEEPMQLRFSLPARGLLTIAR